jgi:glycosyltransferase involved in cell wall biosynthesis
MKALIVCPTIGRIPYLNRMLSSFENQLYDDKHLVIINDDKNIQLCCDRKDVTVINCNKRLSISDKRNIGIMSKDADVIFPLDDDDIFTPDRLHNHLKHYENDDVNVYRNLASYIVHEDIFRLCVQSPHNSKSYRKREWLRVGGYKNNIKTYQDVYLYEAMSGVKVERDNERRDFVYQFGGVNYHSCCLSDEEHCKKTDEIAYQQLKNLGLLNKKYYIESDNEEYYKFLVLKKIFDSNEKELKIRHVSDAKIDISQCSQQ